MGHCVSPVSLEYAHASFRLSEETTMGAGYFSLTKSGNQFKFALKAGNHETILKSELYAAKSSAQNGIASVKANSRNDASYERRASKDDRPYFVLKAANGEVIGKSELYSSASAAEKGIASCKANGPHGPIRDET